MHVLLSAVYNQSLLSVLLKNERQKRLNGIKMLAIFEVQILLI